MIQEWGWSGKEKGGVYHQFQVCSADTEEMEDLVYAAIVALRVQPGRGAIQGFNVSQRVLITDKTTPGDQHTIALLAANGPFTTPAVRCSSVIPTWPSRVPGCRQRLAASAVIEDKTGLRSHYGNCI
jgi:hypothetical protein